MWVAEILARTVLHVIISDILTLSVNASFQFVPFGNIDSDKI